MPGESLQSGASATPRFSALLDMANSCRTTVLFPPRSAKWHRASTADSAALCPCINLAAACSSLASRATARTFLSPVIRLTRAATSLARFASLSASVTELTCGVRAMSKAAAEPILPEPITKSFISPPHELRCMRKNRSSAGHRLRRVHSRACCGKFETKRKFRSAKETRTKVRQELCARRYNVEDQASEDSHTIISLDVTFSAGLFPKRQSVEKGMSARRKI